MLTPSQAWNLVLDCSILELLTAGESSRPEQSPDIFKLQNVEKQSGHSGPTRSQPRRSKQLSAQVVSELGGKNPSYSRKHLLLSWAMSLLLSGP